MENSVEKIEVKKQPSMITILGNLCIEIGNVLGKIITEFFVGKQPTKEEKEAILRRKTRLKMLKEVQEEAQFKKDLELAKRGEYIPPQPKEIVKKKKEENILSNLGKYNPLEGFETNKKQPDFGLGGIGSSNTPNFGLEGFIGANNPMEDRKFKKRD